MLPPLSAGLTRQEAMAVIAELQDAERRLERLLQGLQRLVDEA